MATRRRTRAMAKQEAEDSSISVSGPPLPPPISTSASSSGTRFNLAGLSTPPHRPDTAPMSPLAPISPWPPAETESPYAADLPVAKEVYGLLGVLLTYLAFAAYLVWAFAPSTWLDAVGWTWYPSREWAVIVPCWLMVVVLLSYWGYTALTAFLTPGFEDPSIIIDKRSNVPPDTVGERYYWKFADPEAVPEAVDLPIDLVNRVLYPSRPRPRPQA